MKEIEKEELAQEQWRGHRVIGLDGTCILMSDTPELFECFGRRKGNYGFARFPLARAVVVFNLQTMILMGHEVGGYTTGENRLLRRRLSQLRRGDVLVMDRRYSGANLYVEYQREGLEFITRICGNRRVEKLTIIQTLDDGDLIVEMPVDIRHRCQDRTLPKVVKVRIIQTEAKIRGKRETFWIVTSLLDPRKYPAHEIQVWYKKRWKVEGLIEELKIWLGADVLRSKTPQGIFKEMYARIIGLNLIHWLILKASKKHGKPPERLSVSTTLRLTAAQSLKMSTAPAWRLPELFEQLLDKIAFSTVPYRPDRIEPRMIKRSHQHYSSLKMSRPEWRSLYAMAA